MPQLDPIDKETLIASLNRAGPVEDLYTLTAACQSLSTMSMPLDMQLLKEIINDITVQMNLLLTNYDNWYISTFLNSLCHAIGNAATFIVFEGEESDHYFIIHLRQGIDLKANMNADENGDYNVHFLLNGCFRISSSLNKAAPEKIIAESLIQGN